MSSNWMDAQELQQFGKCGKGVKVSRHALIFRRELLELDDHCRIDAFALLNPGDEGIQIGCHVHVSAQVCLYGGGGRIVLERFSAISGGSRVYTANDDYCGAALTNPTCSETLRNVRRGPVTLARHALVGSGSVILPGVTIGAGAVVGALSLVTRSIPDGQRMAGSRPLKLVGWRNLQSLEQLEARQLELDAMFDTSE